MEEYVLAIRWADLISYRGRITERTGIRGEGERLDKWDHGV